MNGPLVPRTRFQVVPPGSISCFHVSLWRRKQIQKQGDGRYFSAVSAATTKGAARDLGCWAVSVAAREAGEKPSEAGRNLHKTFGLCYVWTWAQKKREGLKELWVTFKTLNTVTAHISDLPLVSLYSSFFWYVFSFLRCFTFCLISDIIDGNIRVNPGACTFFLAVRKTMD